MKKRTSILLLIIAIFMTVDLQAQEQVEAQSQCERFIRRNAGRRSSERVSPERCARPYFIDIYSSTDNRPAFEACFRVMQVTGNAMDICAHEDYLNIFKDDVKKRAVTACMRFAARRRPIGPELFCVTTRNLQIYSEFDRQSVRAYEACTVSTDRYVPVYAEELSRDPINDNYCYENYMIETFKNRDSRVRFERCIRIESNTTMAECMSVERRAYAAEHGAVSETRQQPRPSTNPRPRTYRERSRQAQQDDAGSFLQNQRNRAGTAE